MNGDGCLSRAELMDMFVSLHTGVSPAQLQEIIRASDSNADGYISYQEFVAGADAGAVWLIGAGACTVPARVVRVFECAHRCDG